MGTLLGVRFYTKILDTVGVGKPLSTVIAVLEIAAAAGLVAGMFVPVLGIAAAIGLAALMLGAFRYHLRARDFQGMAAPLVLAALSVVAAVAAG